MVENKLTNLNVSLRESAYYLIGFFYKTGKKYSCTQTKLGKMLSILAFRYAANGQRLFEETIYKYPPNCGTLIKEMALIAAKDVYKRDIRQSNPDRASIVVEPFDNCAEIPMLFMVTEDIPEDIRMEIENLFRHFGAYPTEELGKLLTPIVDKIVDTESNEVVIEKLFDMSKDDFDAVEKNDVINYIFK